MKSKTLGERDKIGTCFLINGGERFSEITLSSVEFSVNPPFVIYDEHWDVFFAYYFDIDDIKSNTIRRMEQLNKKNWRTGFNI